MSDSSIAGHAVTAHGNATISTEQSVFGGASAYFDGSEGTYATVANGSHFDFGDNDFAIEWWYRQTTLGSASAILSFGWMTGFFAPLLVYGETSGSKLNIYMSSNSLGWDLVSGETLLDNAQNDQWYHLAISRYAGNLRLYANGSIVQEIPVSGPLMESPSDLAICARSDGTYPTGAYIDDLRVTKGSARQYTGDTYVVPTSAHQEG